MRNPRDVFSKKTTNAQTSNTRLHSWQATSDVLFASPFFDTLARARHLDPRSSLTARAEKRVRCKTEPIIEFSVGFGRGNLRCGPRKNARVPPSLGCPSWRGVRDESFYSKRTWSRTCQRTAGQRHDQFRRFHTSKTEDSFSVRLLLLRKDTWWRFREGRRKRVNFQSSPSKAHALVFRNLVCVGMFPIMEYGRSGRFDVNDLFLRQGAKQ